MSWFLSRDCLTFYASLGINFKTNPSHFFSFSKKSVENVQRHGKVCVLDIEIEGVKQVRNTSLNPILVFIEPPSIEELEKRLRNRNTESEESLQKRLDTAKSEMDYGKFSWEIKFMKIQHFSKMKILIFSNSRHNARQLWHQHPKLQFQKGIQQIEGFHLKGTRKPIQWRY